MNKESCKVISESLLKNKDMKLEEFYASRQRLEEGLAEFQNVFQIQQSLVKIDVSSNHSKRGLKQFLTGLAQCKNSIEYININNNRSINKSVGELENVIKTCHNLQYLNISDLKMKKKYQKSICQAFVQSQKEGSKLQELVWNYDLQCMIAEEFIKQLTEFNG